MRDEMVHDGVPAVVDVVGGRGEALPLRDASVDVVWLSAVIHHITDFPRCVVELRRVLADDGVVIIRGLFADLGAPSGLEFFSGWHRAVSVFPSTATIETTLSQHGFCIVARAEVEDAGPITVAQAANRVRHLRHADSLLRQFTDHEIADALATMDQRDPDQTLAPSTLGLLAFGTR
jgi:SAM-dependent methyltransferase